MICQPCRNGEHTTCPGGTHCVCQHRTDRRPADGVAEGRRRAAENLFETLHAAGVYAVRTADGRLHQLADVAFAVPNAEGSTE